MLPPLELILRARLDGGQRTWFDGALAATEIGPLATAFAVAPRRAGGGPIALTPEEAAELDGAGLGWLTARTTRTSRDELVRVVLVDLAARRSSDAAALAADWYRQGDNGEKRAVLRALSLLPAPEAHVELAAIGCRSSVQGVFEAVCCENPYPGAHFEDPGFNQMVLKALFTGVALDRIHRLDARKNAELARMAAGYASERRAAGRTVPADIDRVLG